MKFFDLFKNVLKEERSVPAGKKTLLLMDIDDTLLRAASNMKIYRKLPSDKAEIALTPEQYAKEVVTPENKKYYDYRDFRDPNKVYESIVKGAPYINNFKIVDDFYNAGADLGVLTARGCEDAVAKAIKTFLKVRDKNGNLIRPNIPRERIHAVNDETKNYPGTTDPEKKSNVMKKYSQVYDYVYLSDDDKKNRNNAIALKKDPEVGNKIRTIDAEKHRGKTGEQVNEETISEMAMKDVNQEIIDAINAKNYAKALILYFERVKTQDSYAGLSNVKDAFKKMLTFGIARTFGTLEKKGSIPEGSAAELKSYGLSNINDLINGMDYEDNPDYVAPKRAASNIERKRLAGKTAEELKERLDFYKKDGWKCNDETPKSGHNKEHGDFVYVNISRSKDNTSDTAFKWLNRDKAVNEEVISEMAMKDVNDTILNAIKNKDYNTAVKEYFNNIKDQPTYAAKGQGLPAFQHMIKYGISRTFNAMEKSGKVPEGTSAALKDYASKHDREIVDSLGLKSDATNSAEKEAKPAKEAKSAKSTKDYPTYEDSASGALKKIADRINKYSKLIEELKDYRFSSKSIAPFIVSIEKNGEYGVAPGAKKPKVSGIDNDNPFLSDADRYVVPMLNMRKRFIPDFIQKKAEENFSSSTLRNLKKAETLGKEYLEATKNVAYCDYMVSFLNNIVEGLREFNIEHKNDNLTDEQLLADLKSEVDFPYSDFVKLDKWFKTVKMASDKDAAEKTQERKKAKTTVSSEIYKVRNEYITFLNALERAQANDEVIKFVFDSKNYPIIKAVLESPASSNQKAMTEFIRANADKAVANPDLLPRLKNMYSKRADENFNSEAGQEYAKLNATLSTLKASRDRLVASGEQEGSSKLNAIDIRIAKLAEEIENVILDRLAALDLLIKSTDSGLLADAETAAKRYEAIKAKQAKLPNSKVVTFDPKSEKYKQYYDPAGDEKDRAEELKNMYKVVFDAVKADFDEVVRRKLQKTLINLSGKKYSYDEIKKLYAALKSSPEDMFNLLGSDEFKEKR